MPDKTVAQKTEDEVKGEALASLSRVSDTIAAELQAVKGKQADNTYPPGSEAAGKLSAALQEFSLFVARELKAQGE